jgi:beta-lactamase superfamily II metal-dependent hydrolase
MVLWGAYCELLFLTHRHLDSFDRVQSMAQFQHVWLNKNEFRNKNDQKGDYLQGYARKRPDKVQSAGLPGIL